MINPPPWPADEATPAEQAAYDRGRRDERALVNRELRTGDVDAANIKIDDLESLVAELRGRL